LINVKQGCTAEANCAPGLLKSLYSAAQLLGVTQVSALMGNYTLYKCL